MTPSSLSTALQNNSRQAEQQLRQAERALNDAAEQEIRLEHLIADRLSEIASLQLEQDPALDRDTQQQLQQREQAQATLRGDLEQRERQIGTLVEQQRTLDERLDGLEAHAMAQLQEDPAFSSVCEQLDNARQALLGAQTLYEEIRDECAEKLPAYAGNPLFRFLKIRYYGTEQYRPVRFQRALDDFIARKVDFRANQANERILLAMQAHNEAQYQARTVTLSALEQQFEQQREQAREAAGMGAVQQEARELMRQVDEAKAQANALHGQLELYVQGQDPLLQQIRQNLAQRLKTRPLADLVQAAARTPDTRDDALVGELQVLYTQLRQAQQGLEHLHAQHDFARQCYHRAKEAERALRNDFFQRYGYQYLLAQPIEALLVDYMRGELALQTLETLLRASRVEIRERTVQVYTSTSTHSTSWSWGSGSSSDSSSHVSSGRSFSSSSSDTSDNSRGDGFVTSKSSGGGGFRTTDSF
ncbi:hypothetical protein [Pseudomonas sp. UFMG81]|uniref:hypothetical protein n=1 Tax=Pseudomonas sp. UFMG81 TaxID=2745936 RepID=UPI00188E1EE6|nr:hypothetical protein [Pseudomonas sp. UFMG81]